ncbi:MAG: class I SAM-dependent methyltransferase [Geobacter sp.]|nr:MAG: class I SAM-dependent methyltransferase [Geobacter sp.]
MDNEMERGSSNISSSRYDFGAVATRYDRWYETREGRIFDRLEKQAIISLIDAVQPKGTLLEVGCGTGWWSSFFSQLGFSVTGVDFFPEMVAAAQAKHIPAATFEVADAHSLPFADESFAACAAIAALEFMKEAETVLKEMVRCTRRRGGTVYLGLLNASAKANRKRAKTAGTLYEKAHFSTVEEISSILSRFGKVHATVCAFPFSVMLGGAAGRCLDRLGSRLKWKSGAFVAVRIDL